MKVPLNVTALLPSRERELGDHRLDRDDPVAEKSFDVLRMALLLPEKSRKRRLVRCGRASLVRVSGAVFFSLSPGGRGPG
jgi:hypothetical protein